MANFGQRLDARGFLGQRGESILLVNAHRSRHSRTRGPQRAQVQVQGDAGMELITPFLAVMCVVLVVLLWREA